MHHRSRPKALHEVLDNSEYIINSGKITGTCRKNKGTCRKQLVCARSVLAEEEYLELLSGCKFRTETWSQLSKGGNLAIPFKDFSDLLSSSGPNPTATPQPVFHSLLLYNPLLHSRPNPTATLEPASLSPFLYNPLLRSRPNPTATPWLVSLSHSLSHPLQLF